MGARNTSDSIEAYIKSILAQAGMVELKRSELADVFQVPQGTPLLNMDEVDYDIEGAPVFASNEYFADGIFHHTVLRKKL